MIMFDQYNSAVAKNSQNCSKLWEIPRKGLQALELNWLRSRVSGELLIGAYVCAIFPTGQDCARIQFLFIMGLRVLGLGFRVYCRSMGPECGPFGLLGGS